MTCTANCATRPWRFRQDLIRTRRPLKLPPDDFNSPVFTFTTETYESFYLHSQDRVTLSRPHRTALPCFVHKLKGSGDYPIIGVELPAKTHHFTQAYAPRSFRLVTFVVSSPRPCSAPTTCDGVCVHTTATNNIFNGDPEESRHPNL